MILILFISSCGVQILIWGKIGIITLYCFTDFGENWHHHTVLFMLSIILNNTYSRLKLSTNVLNYYCVECTEVFWGEINQHESQKQCVAESTAAATRVSLKTVHKIHQGCCPIYDGQHLILLKKYTAWWVRSILTVLTGKWFIGLLVLWKKRVPHTLSGAGEGEQKLLISRRKVFSVESTPWDGV